MAVGLCPGPVCGRRGGGTTEGPGPLTRHLGGWAASALQGYGSSSSRGNAHLEQVRSEIAEAAAF